jgi:hypothetical protein
MLIINKEFQEGIGRWLMDDYIPGGPQSRLFSIGTINMLIAIPVLFTAVQY